MPDPFHKVITGDCLEVLRTLDAGSVDAVVTDPPYGTASYASDTACFTCEVLASLCRWPTAVFGWPERLVALCVGAGLIPDEWITWAPSNGRLRGFNPKGLWRRSEHIACFGIGKWRELTKQRGVSASRINRDAIVLQAAGRMSMGHGSGNKPGDNAREDDVWEDAAPGLGFLSDDRQHPNEKPVTVMARLVRAMCPEGGTVLDPFCGSGTTGVACKLTGRNFIGIEIDEGYAAIARRRIADAACLFHQPKEADPCLIH